MVLRDGLALLLEDGVACLLVDGGALLLSHGLALLLVDSRALLRVSRLAILQKKITNRQVSLFKIKGLTLNLSHFITWAGKKPCLTSSKVVWHSCSNVVEHCCSKPVEYEGWHTCSLTVVQTCSFTVLQIYRGNKHAEKTSKSNTNPLILAVLLLSHLM